MESIKTEEELRDNFRTQWREGSPFMKCICEAIIYSCGEDREKLRVAYPELVKGYELFNKCC